jgi:8-oxo-dGTP diphosphatase
VPTATVAGIIYHPDGSGRLLLTRRNITPYRGHWCLPGGHIEQGEEAAAAVAREVREEAGLEFAPSFFAYFDEILPEVEVHHLVLVFTGIGEGSPQSDEYEVSELGWFSLSEACSLSLAFVHNQVLEAFAQSLKDGHQ